MRKLAPISGPHPFPNLWIYRQRLGQPSPSLDKLAAGAWPDYAHLGNGTKMTTNGTY